MIVCVCHRVSDRDIARMAQSGCASFDELQFELLVATSCGKCRDCAHETFHRHAVPASIEAGSACVGDLTNRPRQHPVFPLAAQHGQPSAAPAGA
jgi:bacterioferritin-associated ferredoxin